MRVVIYWLISIMCFALSVKGFKFKKYIRWTDFSTRKEKCIMAISYIIRFIIGFAGMGMLSMVTVEHIEISGLVIIVYMGLLPMVFVFWLICLRNEDNNK